MVRLTDQERAVLQQVIKKLKGTAQKVRRAQILLKADADGPNWTDRQIAEVLCMDEQPVQLLKETRTPIPPTAEHARRVDCEYERAGTANIFMFTEPLAGWRGVSVRSTKTKADWATEMAGLLEGRYAHCEKVILVCDNLNTHTRGAFYEVFEPERARELVRRIEFRHTPKHGSWLNIAENELSSLTRQCVAGRRFGDIDTLQQETAAWSCEVNDSQRGVEWHMKIDDARGKLISVYPKIKV